MGVEARPHAGVEFCRISIPGGHDMKNLRRAMVALLLAGLPLSASAGFGFGMNSDDGFRSYDPENYPWGYPPPGYRGYRHPRHWGSRDDRKRDWDRWHKEGANDDSNDTWSNDTWGNDDSGWGRSWGFGNSDDDSTSRFSFGSNTFHFGDSWSPSVGDRWGRYRVPYGPPPYGYYPPRPGWGGYPPPPGYAPQPAPGVSKGNGSGAGQPVAPQGQSEADPKK